MEYPKEHLRNSSKQPEDHIEVLSPSLSNFWGGPDKSTSNISGRYSLQEILLVHLNSSVTYKHAGFLEGHF